MASCSNFSEIEQRTYIKFRMLLEISSNAIHEDLVAVCGDEALYYSTVRRWVNLFRDGRSSVEDAPRSGGPKLSTNEDKTSEVLCEHLNGKCSYKSYDRIRVEEGSSIMVPHSLTFKQKENRAKMWERNLEIYERADPRRLFEIVTGDEMWIPLSPPIRKVGQEGLTQETRDTSSRLVSELRAEKVLYCILFEALGPVVQIPVPKGQTLTGTFTPK
ncbi:Histone-lysine N-methyltransferase SETMAR-like [Oopsacas minuta]|uniref:Histone-lysine N-methyltransferase SETMAR-like n=1 Tax=Oopsacas minuta TaxID=111878 RepID=A0AAV7KFR1_9METZ|nr:Histone-lysine N-methyltransferase SETMAR-like [Oopsacas minuta]